LSDKFTPLSLPRLLQLSLSGIRSNDFMGIPSSLFFRPDGADTFRMKRYGQILVTPVGVAAGPHTQLSQNILAAWLCGARYIELKTIQTLDELEVSKPCIDMQDEGYNCEWSQELKIRESFREYLHAWMLIHILHKELGLEGNTGTLFNMSVGYNLEGILKENVQWFFDKMQDCTMELALAKDEIRPFYPSIDSLEIPACISNHITLSTMHGCPPEEIEKIGIYLIQEKKLHTTVKLNPTLLGPVELRSLLNAKLGFPTEVPDQAFEHDLKYQDALKLIGKLSDVSEAGGLQFSIKLTNTLESLNHRDVFGKKETMMYMSGKALHPISIWLASKLQNEMKGKLDISFSAGVDCFNLAEVLACGLKPVTVCSDLLKPGGYGRLWQFMDILRKKSAEFNYNPDQETAWQHLNDYAERVAENPAYHKISSPDPGIKTSRPLGYFDCIHAPCTDTCPTNQDVPEYLYHTAKGNTGAAFNTVFNTNPFPSVTGMVCDHPCQFKCTRINYDEALHIREIKRFIAENALSINPEPERGVVQEVTPGNLKAAIIGAGPAGLSCAWFLNRAGFEVHVFEEKKVAGGMVSAAIPSFRLTGDCIERDIHRILESGVNLHDHYPVTQKNFESIHKKHDVVFLAAGAQKSASLNIEGIHASGVLDPLEFLYQVKEGNPPGLGRHVVIIGGGNTAMDAARTAFRLVGKEGKVTVAYRRSIKEMPADKGEIEAVREEGIEIIELVNPERVVATDGSVKSLICSRNILEKNSGHQRPSPVKVADSAFEIPCDTLIPAIGQELKIDFVSSRLLNTTAGTYKTGVDGLYIGGDALRGASTAINAIGDGRKAAAEILSDLGLPFLKQPHHAEKDLDTAEMIRRKSIRQYGISPSETPLKERKNFNLVMGTYKAEEAEKEASRCLYCDEICNVCVGVCPNLANFSYRIEPLNYQLQKAVMKPDGSIGFEEDRAFTVDQKFQVMNIRDLCNECGNCTTFCPGNGRPFADKPGLCLSVEAFKREDQGYFLSMLPGKNILIHKEENRIKTLSLEGGQYFFETEQVQAVLDPITFRLRDVKFLFPCIQEYHFTFAAEMSIILKGAEQLSVRN